MLRIKRVFGVLCLGILFVTVWDLLSAPGQRSTGLLEEVFRHESVHRRSNVSVLHKVLHTANGNVTLSAEKRNVLKLITEIWERDGERSGELVLNPLEKVSCPRGFTKYHGVEDLLCMEPPSFLPDHKNPCWYSSSGELQCLPYFQVIGMDKSGSTDLFDRLSKHPQILLNNGTKHKETMWWSWLRYGHWLKNGAKLVTFKGYLEYFADAAQKIEASPSTHLVTGDGTPMDLWDQSGWVSLPQNRGLKEPQYLTPHLIKHVNPKVKLIIILRDPVERLYSDYFFLGLGKMSSSAFHDEVINSIQMLHACTRHRSLRACLYERKLHRDITARIHLGFYPIFIKDWFKVFPREQFFILRTEDFSSSMSEHLKQAFRFLDLKELEETNMKSIVSQKKKYVTRRKLRAGEMKTETRELLEALYATSNTELSHLLKDTKYLWTKV